MANGGNRILITGASGFTGIHACEYFFSKGYEVVGIVRDSKTKISNGQSIQCDLEDNAQVKRVIEEIKPDYVLHLAGKNNVVQSWDNPSSFIHTNVLGTVHLLEGIRVTAPKSKVLVVGSMLQQPLREPANHPYSLSKSLQVLIAQNWGKMFNLNIMIAKPCNLIGPGPSQGVTSIFAEKIIQMEKGEIDPFFENQNVLAVRDFLDVRDAVAAYEMILRKGMAGECYEIGTGKFRSIGEMLIEFKSHTNIPFQVKANKEQASFTEAFYYLYLEKIKGLGWAPTFSFSTSLYDILEYYRKKKGEV